MTTSDRIILWMAAHPWSVGIMLAACIASVGLFDTPVELMEMAR